MIYVQLYYTFCIYVPLHLNVLLFYLRSWDSVFFIKNYKVFTLYIHKLLSSCFQRHSLTSTQDFFSEVKRTLSDAFVFSTIFPCYLNQLKDVKKIREYRKKFLINIRIIIASKVICWKETRIFKLLLSFVLRIFSVTFASALLIGLWQ